ncbi:MAG: hypothetical protein JWO77_1412 [Ilumatobacteraceae bacterium]|nr:hypothetical protein [Ilumatobacteraceae bacterium]
MSDPTGPVLGQVPIPPERTASASGSPTRPGLGCIVLPVLVLLIIGAGAFFLLRSDDDPEPSAATGPTVAAPAVPVLAWADAMEARDYDAACALMTTEAVAEIAINGATCPGELGRLGGSGQYAEASKARILDVVAKGDRAQVTVQLDGRSQTEQTMLSLREEGTWKVAPFDGSLTPPSPTTVPTKPASQLSAECLAEKQSVETALKAFSTAHGTYPTDIRALVTGGYLPQVPPNSILQRDDGIVVMINDCA